MKLKMQDRKEQPAGSTEPSTGGSEASARAEDARKARTEKTRQGGIGSASSVPDPDRPDEC